MMKVILECSNQFVNIIKRKLNAEFEKINYVDMRDDASLYIKEVKSLSDVADIEGFKSKSESDVACLIEDGEFMFELLEYKPLAFLRTQSIEEDLEELVNRMQYKRQGLGTMLDFQCGYQKIRINVQSITYVESFAHYLLIHTVNSTIKVREKISEAYKQLQPYGFIQVHKSYLVSQKYIQKIDSDELVMRDLQVIPIGKKYKKDMKKSLS